MGDDTLATDYNYIPCLSRSKRVLILQALTFLVSLVFHSTLLAQDSESEGNWFPDTSPELREKLSYRNEHFSIGFGFAALFDYTVFDQDQDSLDQLGKQENDFERRSLRLLMRGTLDFLGPWSYLLAAEYKGFARAPDDPIWNFTDVALTRSFGDGSQRLTIGKQKQYFIYEMAGAAAHLPHHERFLEPFFIGRSWGVSYSTSYLDRRIGLQLGWYNDWFIDSGDFAGNGNQWAARLTALPVWEDEGERFLHLGISTRYQEDENDLLHFWGRPGSHVTDFYVDSGKFEADYSHSVALEALWQSGKFSVLGEYVKAWVSARAYGDPQFDGYYLSASYVFNGSQRPYDRIVRYARRIIPGPGSGAWEPIVRFGRVDLDDAGVRAAAGALVEARVKNPGAG